MRASELQPVQADDDLSTTRERMVALDGNAALLHALNLHSNVAVTDSAGRIIDVNDKFCCACGYGRDELLGKSHAQVNSGVHPPAFWASMWLTISAGEPWRGEICNRAKNGDLQWWDCMIAPIRGPDGKPAIHISICNEITATKQIELDLRASEAFLDRTGQTAGVGGWALDIATRDLHWSAQMMRIHDLHTAYKPRLLPALAFFPAPARSQMTRVIREACRSGKGWDLELPLVTARGRSIWVRIVAEVEAVDGRPIRLLGSMQDISKRKQTESALARERTRMVVLLEQLKELNERFAVASDAAGIAIWELDASSKTLIWDDRMHFIYRIERTAEAVVYDQWVNAVHVDDREAACAAVERVLRGDVDLNIEFRIVRPDGEVRWIKGGARVLRDASGVALSMTGVNIDITEAKLAETHLFKTSSMLRTVLDSATEVSIVATDPSLTIKMFNVGAEHMFGYASDEVVERSTPARLHDQEDLQRFCEKVSAEIGRPVKGWEVFIQPQMLDQVRECMQVTRDGRLIKVSQKVTAMHTYEGQLLGYLSVGRDITQQSQYEDSLREATARAEQANRAKSEFLANMSHEIRTPMNAVIGLSYLLKSTTLDEQQTALLANLDTASTSLLAIINDVLDLSKIEAGELLIEKTAFDPCALVTEVIEVMQVHARAKRIEFKVRMPAEWPASLDGDPTRLKQILTNLLSNAIRFTDIGGVELGVATISVGDSDVELRFTVKDTGIGIAAAAQARLFAPFAQADASITRRYGGTGLGLSIVKSLIKVLGGELQLNSTPGVGSLFTVCLTCPRSAPEPGAAERPAELSVSVRHSLQGVRVLVVDDSDMNLEVVRCILEQQGAEVALARNGQEALDRLQSNTSQFDAILMDVQMPDLDGHAATRRIRGDLGLVDVPIIALTAGALSSERDRALASGMDDFLVKPFEPASLVRCIREHVDVAAAEAGTPIAPVSEPVLPCANWPEIIGIDSRDSRIRLSNDQGLFFSSLTRLLVEFSDIGIAAVAPGPADLVVLAKRMHKLKGSAGMLGANSIHSLAAEAEAVCIAGTVERAFEAVAALDKELASLRDSATPAINAAAVRMQLVAATEDGTLCSDVLAELIQLLRERNLSAMERFRCLAPQLRRHLPAGSYEIAQGHMESLRFDEAATILLDNPVGLDAKRDQLTISDAEIAI